MSYKFFLAADDVRCEQVDTTKAAQFDERAQGVQQELGALQQVCPKPLSSCAELNPCTVQVQSHLGVERIQRHW